MNYLDCLESGEARPAIAVCTDCGAAACGEHAVVRVRHLTATGVIGRVVALKKTSRMVRCLICDAAEQARAAAGP